MKIEYKGRDITDKVSVNTCLHDMYAEKHPDTLLLRMNDIAGLWDTWAPQIGDLIKVSEGHIGTGAMYVSHCVALNGLYKIRAKSLPATHKNKSNKAWQKVRLLQIGSEIANRHELKFESYGVTNHKYNYILQSNMDDFTFLSKRCELEGCAMLVCDNKLVIYSESYMEHQKTNEFLDISIDADFDYLDRRSKQYGSCEVTSGVYHGSFSVPSNARAVLKAPTDIYTGSNAEAERFAKNLLRNENKNGLIGYVHGDVLTSYAAGSCAVLKNAKAPAWDGPVFITHIRNDYGNYRNKMFFRKPLEGY